MEKVENKLYKFNNLISKISDLEKFYIDTVSFIPTNKEIEYLILISNSANRELKVLQDKSLNKSDDEKKTIRDSINNTLLSKIKVLIPITFNLNDTILVKTGLNPDTTKIELQNNYLYIINDRDIPFEKTSNGPNGVLVNTNSNLYGMNRINLFHKSIKSTKKLLKKYLSSRNKNINNIFELFVGKLNTYSGNDIDMLNVIKMFNIILLNVQSGKKLYDCGISVVSFCQTWMKKDYIGLPQFSVPSPHFQTRFYVNNIKKLIKCELAEQMLLSYIKVIQRFTLNMQPDYGIGGTGQSFINLDKLNQMMK